VLNRLISSSLLSVAVTTAVSIAPAAAARGESPQATAPAPGAASSEDLAATQIRAAIENAVQKLHDDIAAERLTSRYTVGSYLDEVGGGEAQLSDVLHHADQIGGPRWVDEQTCQVKLVVPGESVARVLTQIAKDAGPKSPVPAEAIAARVRDWNSRSYVATGSSIAGARAELLRPGESNRAWRAVSEEARRRAVNAAKQNAVERALDNLRPIALSESQILGDVLADKQVSEQLSGWLASRPVTEVQFRPDLFVEVTLGVFPDELLDALRDSARGKAAAEAALTDQAMRAKLRRQIAQRVVPPVGRASVAAPRTMPASAVVPVVSQRAVTIPSRAPQWARGTPLIADATAPRGSSPLKTEFAADRRARERLREHINALTLETSGGGITLGEAASRSANIAGAIDSVVQNAKPYKVDYLADGSVAVKMSIDPRDLWDALSELP
jgi:hypothetical protein